MAPGAESAHPRYAGCITAREGTVEPITLTVAAVVGLAIVSWVLNHRRNRPFTRDVPAFRASRWTKGNRIWPTQVAVFRNRVVRYTPRLFGHFEETIGIDQVAGERRLASDLRRRDHRDDRGLAAHSLPRPLQA
jgi:hypothetical protein